MRDMFWWNPNALPEMFNGETRDRKGGHVSTDLSSQEYFGRHRSMVKKANRKKQRKQHKRITRNDVLEYHQMHVETLREAEELWLQEQEELYLEFLHEKDLEDSLEAFEYDPWEHDYYNPMDYDDDYYGDAYNDYMDRHEDHSYVAGSLTREGLTKLDMNARITEQDPGESLGDILARALRSEHDKVG